MKTRTSRTAIWIATLLFGSTTLAFAGGHQKMTIGEVTALIAEASTADEPRACDQLSQMTAATQWMAPRTAQARLS